MGTPRAAEAVCICTESPPQPIMSAARAKFVRVGEQPRSAPMPPPSSKKPVSSALDAESSSPDASESPPARRVNIPAASSAETRAENMTTKPQTFSIFPTEAVTERAKAPGRG